MCGISGCCGKYAVKQALGITLGQLSRGTQGVGVAYITPQGLLQVQKAAEHPLYFAARKGYFVTLETNSAISHNRMPSRGDVNLENTHPFMDCKGRFALIHNGTVMGIDGERDRLIKNNHSIQGSTDSEALAHLLCEKLDEGKTMAEAMGWLAGSMYAATILVLAQDGSIYGLKSGHYPLTLYDFRDDSTVFLASSGEAIQLATFGEFSGRNYFEEKISNGDVLHVKDGKLVSVTNYKQAEIKPYVSYNQYASDYGELYGSLYGNRYSGDTFELDNRIGKESVKDNKKSAVQPFQRSGPNKKDWRKIFARHDDREWKKSWGK